MKEIFIKKLLEMQIQFRILHWQTKSYAQHKALGELYENLDDLIDDFAEIILGKSGNRFDFDSEFSIVLKNMELSGTSEFISEGVEDIINISNDFLDDDTDTDLLNLKDEIIALLNKTKYLLTLE